MILSVILVSYNNKIILDECLSSIYRYNDIDADLEVIVVEQSTTDDIYHELSAKYSSMIFIRNENQGFGGGNNRGAIEARGQYLLFLNTDTILIEPIFRATIDKFKSDEKLGAFGVQLLDRNRNKALSFAVNNPFSPCSRVRNKLYNKLGMFREKFMYISGADIFIRKDVFDRIGGFDKKIFMYFEDTLLCNEVVKLGYRVRFFNDLRIIHLQGGSTSSPNVLTSKMFLDSYKHYCKKKDLDFSSLIRNQIRQYRLEAILFSVININKSASNRVASKALEKYYKNGECLNEC